MNGKHTILMSFLLGLLAIGLFFAFGPYGPVFAGAAGIFATLGIYFTEPERELHRQHYTLRPLDDPLLSSHDLEINTADGLPSWFWKLVVIGYSLLLIVVGFALEAQTHA